MIKELFILNTKGRDIQKIINKLRNKYSSIYVTTSNVTIESIEENGKGNSAVIVTDIDDCDTFMNTVFRLKSRLGSSDLILMGNEDADYYFDGKTHYYEIKDGEALLGD